jgi:hypothetical protein
MSHNFDYVILFIGTGEILGLDLLLSSRVKGTLHHLAHSHPRRSDWIVSNTRTIFSAPSGVLSQRLRRLASSRRQATPSSLASSGAVSICMPIALQICTTLLLIVLNSPRQIRPTWLGCTRVRLPISVSDNKLAARAVAIRFRSADISSSVAFMQFCIYMCV